MAAATFWGQGLGCPAIVATRVGGRYNIQVYALMPGWVETELTDGARAQVPGLYERVLGRILAGRWGQPEDMVGTLVFVMPQSGFFVAVGEQPSGNGDAHGG